MAASDHDFCKNETVIFFAAGLDSTNRVERTCENSPCAHPDLRVTRLFGTSIDHTAAFAGRRRIAS
jgi:hypothetical protein